MSRKPARPSSKPVARAKPRLLAGGNPQIAKGEGDAAEGIYSQGIGSFTLIQAGSCGGCVGDLNADGQVGAQDLAALLNAWGGAAGDINGDGTTNAQDLAALLSAWGPCVS